MSERADLLIEIGTEELPPKALNQLASALLQGLLQGLDKAQLPHDAGAARWYASPRRLACLIPAVAERQPDREMERRGPAVDRAYDDAGQPTAAAQGFARSVGLAVEQLQTLKTDQGEWLYHRFVEAGKNVDELLPELLEKAVSGLPVPKPMRWGAHETRFVRPVHWLLALHGDRVPAVAVLGQQAGRVTYGHRIHAPGAHSVATVNDYLSVLESAYVVADVDQRRQRVIDQSQQLAESAGLRARLQPELVDEVTALVEWPVALLCTFDEDFLQVPAEALISSMELHQKFFPLLDENGALSARFIAVANLESTAPERVRDGFERVVRPRLADARFFWDQDRKKPLQDYFPALENVVFQKKLGSLADKSMRVAELAGHIATELKVEPAAVKRAAELARCDLLTEMVGEFPELQGVMGRYYALASGESDAVAIAIDEHYSPRQSGDPIAASETGRILAVAEKTDTLIGIFAAGLKPTGAKDPFALRRAALGLLRTVIEGEMEVSLRQLLQRAAAILGDHLDVPSGVVEDVRQFILDRLTAYLREQGYSAEVIQAVSALDVDHPLDFVHRVRAVAEFARLPQAESLSAANKRCANILRQAKDSVIGEIDTSAFADSAEGELHQAMSLASNELKAMLEQGQYSAALNRLAQLQGPVDHFFDQVMVMAEDPQQRNNRLALLTALRQLFLSIADVSRLSR
ncbi:MAG: glycine--tRNA ligase subunit beta [Wenzhouxiangellaceae bacterium]